MRRTVVFRRNRNIADCGNPAGAVFFADDNITARRYVQLHLAACSYVFAYQNSTSARSHGYILACGDRFTYGNITGARLRNHVAGYIHIPFKVYITNIFDCYGQVLFGQGIARYVNTAVTGMQCQVAARIQHTVMGDLNTSWAFLFLIQRFYSDIAILRLGGAVHSDGAVRYIQVDILLRQNRIICGHFANLDVAGLRCDVHAVAGRSNRCLHRRAAVLRCDVHCPGSFNLAGAVFFADDNITARRYVQLHLAACSYVFAYQNSTSARSHGYILACGDRFTYGNITGARLRNHVAGYIHIPLELHIAFIIYRHGQVLFGQGIVRYVDTAVRGMQGQVETRIQLTVMGDHDILGRCAVLLVIQRFYGDTAFLGLCRAVHFDYAVRYLQADIVLGQDGVFGLHFANLDIAVIQIHGYAAAGGGDGCLDGGVAILRGNINITAGNNLAGAVILADSNASIFRRHRHIVYNSDIFVDQNIALLPRFKIEVVSRGYLIRHMEVAVLHDHGGVVAGLHLAVLVNDNVLSGVARCIGFVPGQ